MRKTRSAVLIVTILSAILLVAAGALAHGDEGHGGSDGADGNETGDAYQGPHPHARGTENLLGLPFWGEVSVVADGDARPSQPTNSRGWVAWIDEGAGDLVAYNLSRDVRVQVTDDPLRQQAPALDGSRLVWIEVDGTTKRVRFYDLDAGQTRVLFETESSIQSPAISDRWVTWQVRSDGEGASRATWDVQAYDLQSGRTVPVATGSQTDVDPVIVGDHVAWRQREYTQWDVRIENLTTGREGRVTADVNDETHLRAGPDSLLFTKQLRDRPDQRVYRYHPSTGRTVETGLQAPQRDGAYPMEDGILYLQSFVENRTLSLFVDSTGTNVPLHQGRLDIQEMTVPADRTVALVVGSGEERILATYTISPLATAPRPRVLIEEPTEGATVTNTTLVRGQVVPRDWPDPTDVYVSVSGSPRWVPASGTTTWQAEIDLSQAPTGRHVIEVAAEFPGGTPQDETVSVLVGQPLDFTKDLSPRFDSQTQDLLGALLGTIPLLVVLVLALVALLLFLARTYLRWLRERYPEVRYVPPDEPRAPAEPPGEAEVSTEDPSP